jgi:hypothetical protein
MGKYDPLTAYLKKTSTSEVPMSFEEVAHIIGARLPPSAYMHRPWWANETTGHVHAKSWLNAGYETTQVDMESKKLVFKRLQAASSGMAEEAGAFQHAENKQPARHPAIGALKGLLWIEPGYDLTQPTWDDDDEKAFDEKWDRLLK